MKHTVPKRASAVVAIVVALVAVGCQRVQVSLYDTNATPNLTQHYVVRNGANTYTLKLGPGAVRVSAPANQPAAGTELRSVFWPPDTPLSESEQSCATWTDQSGSGSIQQGLALRVRTDGARFRTIVV